MTATFLPEIEQSDRRSADPFRCHCTFENQREAGFETGALGRSTKRAAQLKCGETDERVC
jgi:hypothetical protein